MKQNNLTPSEYAQMLRQDGYVLVGSRYFFEGMPDFNPHDYDFAKIADEKETGGRLYRHVHQNGCCVNLLTKSHVTRILDYARANKEDMIVCSLFVPELASLMEFDFMSMHRLIKPFVDRLRCTKWAYYGIIYDAYLTNGATYLTDKQRQTAFEVYKEARNQ